MSDTNPAPSVRDGEEVGRELERLSAAASQGMAEFEIVPFRCGHECDDVDLPGFLRVGGVQIAEVHEKYGPGVTPLYEADGAYLAALWNAHRSGKLIASPGFAAAIPSREEYLMQVGFIAYADGTWKMKRPGQCAPPTAQAYTFVPITLDTYRVLADAHAPGFSAAIPTGVEGLCIRNPAPDASPPATTNARTVTVRRDTERFTRLSADGRPIMPEGYAAELDNPLVRKPASCDEHSKSEDAIAAESRSDASAVDEVQTPEVLPKSPSPHPDDKTAGMTVEEARDVLAWLDPLSGSPRAHAAYHRDRADLLRDGELSEAHFQQALRIETALLTLQSERGDQS